MQALDLHVEQEGRVQLHALVLGDDLAQLLLLFQLDGVELLDGHVVDRGLEILQPVELRQEAACDLAFDQPAELGVAQPQPAARRDAVRLVLEALGEDGVPVLEQVVFQDLRVDAGHAVDGGGHIDGHIRHIGAAVLDDRKAGAGEFVLEAGVDLLDDLAKLRHDRAQQLHIPLFQRLAHDGVVRRG